MSQAPQGRDECKAGSSKRGVCRAMGSDAPARGFLDLIEQDQLVRPMPRRL